MQVLPRQRRIEQASSLETVRGLWFGWLVAIVLLIGVAVAVTYANAIQRSFLSDDWSHVYTAAWSRSGTSYLRPVVDASFWFDRTIHGIHSARGFYVTNIVIHALNSLLVFVLIRELGSSDTGGNRGLDLAAASGALLFAVIAGHAGAVSWVVGRGDVIATFFVLLAFWCYLRFRAGGRATLLVLSLAAFELATFAKEAALSFPFALLAYEGCLVVLGTDARPWRARLRGLLFPLAYMLPLMVNLAVRHALEVRNGVALTTFDPTLLVQRTFDHSVAAVVPSGWLTRAFPPPALHNWWLERGFLVLAVVAVAAVFVTTPRADPRPARIAGLCAAFVAILLPVSQVRTEMLYDDLSKRYNYLPSAFVVVIVALIARQLLARSRAGLAAFTAVMIVAIVGNAVALRDRNAVWHEAGDTTRSIVQQLAARSAEDPGPLLVVGIPDHLGNAFVFRNGFANALQHADVQNVLLLAISAKLVPPARGRANRIAVHREGDVYVFTPASRSWRSVVPSNLLLDTHVNGRGDLAVRLRFDARFAVYSRGRFFEVSGERGSG